MGKREKEGWDGKSFLVTWKAWDVAEYEEDRIKLTAAKFQGILFNFSELLYLLSLLVVSQFFFLFIWPSLCSFLFFSLLRFVSFFYSLFTLLSLSLFHFSLCTFFLFHSSSRSLSVPISFFFRSLNIFPSFSLLVFLVVLFFVLSCSVSLCVTVTLDHFDTIAKWCYSRRGWLQTPWRRLVAFLWAKLAGPQPSVFGKTYPQHPRPGDPVTERGRRRADQNEHSVTATLHFYFYSFHFIFLSTHKRTFFWVRSHSIKKNQRFQVFVQSREKNQGVPRKLRNKKKFLSLFTCMEIFFFNPLCPASSAVTENDLLKSTKFVRFS